MKLAAYSSNTFSSAFQSFQLTFQVQFDELYGIVESYVKLEWQKFPNTGFSSWKRSIIFCIRLGMWSKCSMHNSTSSNSVLRYIKVRFLRFSMATSIVSKILVWRIEELSMVPDRTRRIAHRTLGPGSETNTENDAAFSIGKSSILEFLSLIWDMILLCHKSRRIVLGTLIGNFGTHC